MAMSTEVKRARAALLPGTEPYAALMTLMHARIEEHRAALEMADTLERVRDIQGRIAEDRELVALLRPTQGRALCTPPADY